MTLMAWSETRRTGGGRLLKLVILASFAAVAVACGRDSGEDPADAAAEEMVVGTDGIAIVQRSVIESGPRISGSLEPKDQAAVRAEVGGSVTGVSAEPGQSVARGQALARIEDRTARDAYLSAQSGVRAAQQAFELAERQAERSRTLAAAGAIAERDLELAVSAMATARAQLDDARSRLAAAQKQLDNTTVRSPIAGIVSQRPVNAGDVVSPGTLLFNIVDPSSMRLMASVPSEQLGLLSTDMAVQFQVRGYPNRVFDGRIDRISPTADPVTRQIPIWVSIPNRGGTLVAGLFAEGRVATESRETLVIPLSAVEVSSTPTVLKIAQGKVQSVPVTIGIRDDANDRVEITAGLSAGDTVLVGAARSITPGMPVRVGPAAESTARPGTE
ncbi:MAG TPA: efflux RND transporter periplasmic adaptor subunit [Longimicrobiales bacterium]